MTCIVVRRLIAMLVSLIGCGAPLPLTAQVLPDGPVLAAADLRAGQSLDGEWRYSIDPYRDGAAGDRLGHHRRRHTPGAAD